MKPSKQEFKQLQSEWYDLLAKSGFKDIEKVKGEEFVLAQTSSYCYRSTDEFERDIKAQYFRCIAQAVHDENTVFRNKIDRYILMRHAEGAKIKVIMEELLSKGISRHRHTIRFIIRRYEIAWGIRTYEPNQMNCFEKKKEA